jgi:Holliday junction DNA helicase RuvB
MVCQDPQKVLNAHRIIKDGLTVSDIKILQYLKEAQKPVGAENLAMIIGITKADYNYVVEPFLVTEGFVRRTSRGREITSKGELLLQELK